MRLQNHHLGNRFQKPPFSVKTIALEKDGGRGERGEDHEGWKLSLSSPLLSQGMILADPILQPQACTGFWANVFLLFHTTRIGKRFQATVYIGNVSQTATIEDMNRVCVRSYYIALFQYWLFVFSKQFCFKGPVRNSTSFVMCRMMIYCKKCQALMEMIISLECYRIIIKKTKNKDDFSSPELLKCESERARKSSGYVTRQTHFPLDFI